MVANITSINISGGGEAAAADVDAGDIGDHDDDFWGFRRRGGTRSGSAAVASTSHKTSYMLIIML